MTKIFPGSISNLSVADIMQDPQNKGCRLCKKVIYCQDPEDVWIFPCNCKQPIHSSCLSQEFQFVKRGKMLDSKKQKHYECSSCKKTIRFHCQSHLECRSFSEISKYVQKRQGLCSFLVIASLIMIALLVILLLLCRSGRTIGASATDSSIIICLIIVIAILFFVISFYALTEIIIKRRRKVGLIESKSTKKRKKSNIEIVDCE